MKVVCLSVGKKHDATIAVAIHDYQKRLQPYVSFEFEFVASGDIASESSALVKRLKDDDFVVLLDERGHLFTNAQLTESISRMQQDRYKRLVIIIGGAYGVDKTVRNRSNVTLSLSRLVFPHQLVRLLVVEQLYRSFNTLAGGKYHHS